MKVAVGLSGGIDSAVALALLKAEGHEVFGLTMRLWQAGRYRGGAKDACFGPGEMADIARAESLCQRLGVPLHVIDCAEAYERHILADFRAEYLAGRTPNPCLRCNAMMKFGLLPRLAHESGLAFDRFATGHYARLRHEADGTIRLLMAADRTKDQTYFLARLAQAQLREALFPLGERTKAEVRELARTLAPEMLGLAESQDFYSGELGELIGRPDVPGPIEDTTGQRLGTHRGHWHYTLGQRKGLGIAAAQPLYVLRIDPCRNALVVGPAEATRAHRLTLGPFHWIAQPAEGELEVRVRSSARPVPATRCGQTLTVPGGLFAPAPGQTAVLSRGEEILGCALIEKGS